MLVAQHRHLNLFPGFLQTQHGNRDRTLVVIDEMPELVNVEKISANDIQQNIQLFQQLVETESNPDLENVIYPNLKKHIITAKIFNSVMRQ
ncbi:TPA: hypothetical protein EYO57_33005 [Candidatus Poribacteria bacterium]|nr:hypothetical protein [Candidatus Poribacteria bacterium]